MINKIIVLTSVLVLSSFNAFAVEQIKSADFDKSIAQNKVVVEFFSPNCPHCKKMESVVEFAESNLSDVKFYKIDVVEEEFAKSKGITSWPTFQVFENGKLKREVKGSMSAELFIKKISGKLTIQERIDELTKEANTLMSKRQQALDAIGKLDQRLYQIDGAIKALEEIKQ